jgi:hypothetical protein
VRPLAALIDDDVDPAWPLAEGDALQPVPALAVRATGTSYG